jgi:acetyltransferase-like isoleucine patch superfamily enzyme
MEICSHMKSPLAVVETSQVANNVTIKEYSIIRANVAIEEDVVIHPFVVIEEGVRLGRGVEIFPGSYIGKTPKGAGATSRPIKFEAKITIGNNCVIGPNAVIYYDVTIGENTLLGDGASVREGCHIGSRCIIGRYVTLNYSTAIGDDVKIMDHSWLAGNMRVENGVFISGGVLTANDNEMGFKDYEEKRVIGPDIHNGARIGAGAVILPNITIGEGSVVAAGAVVTKSVAPYNVMMGVPARPIRRAVPSDNPDRT